MTMVGTRPTQPAQRWRHAPDSSLAMSVGLASIVGLLVVPPLAFLLVGAVRTGSPGQASNAFTLAHIRAVLTSDTFLEALRNTIVLSVLVATGSLVVGSVLAWLVARTDLRARRFWESVLAVPLYISPLFLSLAAIALIGRGSYTAQLFRGIGGDTYDVHSFSTVLVILVIFNSASAFLYMLGPLGAVDSELEQAAWVLGASERRAVLGIVARLVVPAAIATWITVFALAAESFTVPGLLAGQKYRVLATSIYFDVSYDPTKPNEAAVIGLVLVILSSVGIYGYRRVSKVSARYAMNTGKPRSQKLLHLGRAQLPVQCTLSLYALVVIVVPLLTLFLVSVQPYVHGGSLREMFRGLTLKNYHQVLSGANANAVMNTIKLGVIGATAICGLGFLVSYAVNVLRVRGSGLLDFASTIMIAVPGMALAVGMLWAYVHLPSSLYGTIWILVIAYVARWLPQGVRATGAAMLALGRDADEAARVVGAGLWRRLGNIFLPLTRRGVLSAWMLAAVFIINELPVTILLYAPSSTTVSVEIWNEMAMSGASQAAAFALLQVLVTFVLVTAAYFASGQARTSAPSAAS